MSKHFVSQYRKKSWRGRFWCFWKYLESKKFMHRGGGGITIFRWIFLSPEFSTNFVEGTFGCFWVLARACYRLYLHALKWCPREKNRGKTVQFVVISKKWSDWKSRLFLTKLKVPTKKMPIGFTEIKKLFWVWYQFTPRSFRPIFNTTLLRELPIYWYTATKCNFNFLPQIIFGLIRTDYK